MFQPFLTISNLLDTPLPHRHFLCLLGLLSLFLPLPAPAGYFNCSVIYDEFDNLMNKQFLEEPDRYVSTVNQRLTRNEFETLQKGQFLLHEERGRMGIAVFKTSENLRGRLLFSWSDPLADGQSYFIVELAVIFGNVKDGGGVSKAGPYRIKAGFGLDLDSGKYDSRIGQSPDAESENIVVDLRHGIDPETGDGFIESANDAQLFFPVESMCSETSQ